MTTSGSPAKRKITKKDDEPRVPAFGARRRLHALYAIGHVEPTIAPHLNCGSNGTIPFKPHMSTIPLRVHEEMCRVFDLLRNTPGPRAAQAPGLAERFGWYTPQQWKLAYIDNPNSSPDAIVGKIDLSDGLCRTEGDPNLWGATDTTDTAHAKRICHRCPVRRDCLTLALVKPERWNVWGGVGEGTREPIHKRLIAETAGRPLLGSPELEAVLDHHCGSLGVPVIPAPTAVSTEAPAGTTCTGRSRTKVA